MITDAQEYATSMTIGIAELAELLGTSKSSLRYYEQEGLITPERAEANGYRQYSIHSLVELTDIIMFRNIGIPVKDVRHLLDAPFEEVELALDGAEDELLAKIEEAQETLRLLSARRRKIRAVHEAMRRGPRLIDNPPFETLYSYELGSKEFLSTYMHEPQQARFSLFFPACATRESGYLNCSAIPLSGAGSEPVWKKGSSEHPWMECLLTTEYDLPDENDLFESIEHLQGMGYGAGSAIAEYLTFGADEDGKRSDYYLCWIEAL